MALAMRTSATLRTLNLTRVFCTTACARAPTFWSITQNQASVTFTWLFNKLGRFSLRKRQSKPPHDYVVPVGNPILRGQALAVDHKNIKSEETQEVLDQLVKVMRKKGAVGLSAPQVGVGLQIIVVECTRKQLDLVPQEIRKIREMQEFPLKIFINPKLKVTDYSTVVFPEGCESLPGYQANVPRYYGVNITGLDRDGMPLAWQVTGWPARILQHEVEHLRGDLYIDIMDSRTFMDYTSEMKK
ncbi:peptide deformylase, mitochondrial-like [Branchiostoma lanceolatum]|uniref:peptide deformylase, mitochondrial-like n=1 Tax=Branchiostoma lanceolatum TaxID=7740 RepID=UPI003451B1B5